MSGQRMMQCAACVWAAGVAIAGGGAVARGEAIRVVILSGQNVHDWKTTTPLLEKLYNDSKRFKVVDTVNEVAKVTDATFSKCDVIVSNWTCHPEMTGGPWTAEGKKAFADAIGGGKGLVQFHAACTACNDWAEFQEISGLTWKWGHTGHTAYHTFKVVVRDRSHPITQGLADFWITDELYQKMVKLGKSDFHLLADAFAEPQFSGTGQWEPVLITTRLGKGRGVNFLLGHDVHAMRSVAWQTLMLRGTEWAATGRVTIPMPENWPTTAAAAEGVGVDVDTAITAAAAYAFGQDRQPLFSVEQLVNDSTSRTGKAAAADRAQLAARLGEAVATCKTPEGKAFFCRQLAMIGTPEQVPLVGPLLADEPTAMMARYALERIAGPEASRALRDALPKAAGKLKLGIVNSIGNRADADAVTLLEPLIKDGDAELAQAVVSAVSKIGTAAAAEVLRNARGEAADELRAAITDACLACAERLAARGDKKTAAGIYRLLYGPAEPGQTRAAALRGLVLTDPSRQTMLLKEALASTSPELHAMVVFIVRNLPRAGDTKGIADQVMRMEPEAQALLIAALADRGDRAATGAIRRSAASDNETVRMAAIAALGKLGTDTDVPLLIERALQGGEAERAAATTALASIPGAKTEQVIAQTLTGGDEKARALCVDALLARGANTMIFHLLGQAGSDHDVATQTRLIRVLPTIATERALAVAKHEAGSEDAAIKAAGLEAMCAWPTPAPMDDLFETARDEKNKAAKPAILQALARMLGQHIATLPAERRAADAAVLIGDVLKLAERPADKKPLLELLGARAVPEAMHLAMTYLDDPDVGGVAGMAAVKVAGLLGDAHRDEVTKTLRQIMATSKVPTVVQAADAALGKLGSASQPAVATAPPSYRWRRTDSTVALLDGDRIVWQFNYGKDLPKPYFNPLNLPDGTELVWLSPTDHPWHFALWFSWKEINGLNYWEQWNVPGQGRMGVTDAKATTNPDFSAQIDLAIAYHPDGKPVVMTEKREITVGPPAADGSYRIDWASAFAAADQDAHLKGGTAGGGYAGLSVRISKDSRDWQLLDSENRRDVPGKGMAEHAHGQHARWTDFSLVSTITGTTAGVAVFDHPGNLRYPSYWHDVIMDQPKFGYFSPAPLWSEPYTLPAGKELILRYRVLVHPGRPD
ncbi:MAG: PmoA family protein, partial [Planctomycetes bacterium]|nr:PmoA family protein [Planctomycetota bacterium]